MYFVVQLEEHLENVKPEGVIKQKYEEEIMDGVLALEEKMKCMTIMFYMMYKFAMTGFNYKLNPLITKKIIICAWKNIAMLERIDTFSSPN